MWSLQCLERSGHLSVDATAFICRPLAATMVVANTMTEPAFLTHAEPIWREKADFVIQMPVPGDTPAFEQLWARRCGEATFEICCIPFFVYDVALGDIVETDGDYIVKRVMEPSGRYVFRVWFGNSFYPRSELESELLELGALLEWSSENLCAVDATDLSHAEVVADCLDRFERLQGVSYETGRSAAV